MGRDTKSTTIANGTSLSGAMAVGAGYAAAAVVMPTAWTAANITFQGSVDGTNFYDLYNTSGTEISITAGASRIIQLDPGLFSGINHLKVRSGTSGTPVNQGAQRSITISVVELTG